MGPTADLDTQNQKNLLPLSVIEPRFLGVLSRRVVAIPTGLSRLE
jgi:hypothetical protein